MKKKVVLGLISIFFLSNTAIAYADSSDKINPPINPLPSLYELTNNESLNDFNLEVPPPINPLPRKSVSNDLFTKTTTTTDTETSSNSYGSTTSTTKKTSNKKSNSKSNKNTTPKTSTKNVNN